MSPSGDRLDEKDGAECAEAAAIAAGRSEEAQPKGAAARLPVPASPLRPARRYRSGPGGSGVPRQRKWGLWKVSPLRLQPAPDVLRVAAVR